MTCFSRFESFSVAPSIPTVWIVENTQQPNSFLRSQRGIDFPPGSSRTNLRSIVQNPRVWSARSISPSASMAATVFALFCLTKPTLFFLRLFASGRSSSKNGISYSDVPWTSSFRLLQPAATQIAGISFAHNREIQWSMLISLRSREIGSGIDVTSPTPLRWLLHSDLIQNGVFLGGIFRNSKNHRKSRIWPN